MPRGRGTPTVGFRINLDLWDQLGEAAETVGMSRGELLRRLIRWYLRKPGARLPTRPGTDSPPAG